MMTLKTNIVFENGKALETVKYQQEFSARAIAIERAKFFILHYMSENRLSGQITIEAKNDKMHFACDAKSEKQLKTLMALLKKNYGLIEGL
jgi:enoyl-[acyl-carrier-protein] reductase (NADH)